MVKKILIIEDEPELVDMLRSRFELLDYVVDGASDGQVGLKKAKENKPDLILLDIMMPQMDGYDVCRTLKSDPKTEGIKIIILSAKVSDEDQKKGFECGADDYVTKPFDAPGLIKKIQSHLNI